MIDRRWFAFALVLVIVSVAACKKAEPVAESTAAPVTTSDSAPASAQTSTTAGQSWLDDVTIDSGKELAANGAIVTGKAVDDFKPGESVNVSITVGSAPANTPVKVVWMGPKGTKIAEETKNTTAGQQYLTFTSGDTKSWARGEYQIEIWLGNTKVTDNFKII